MIIVLKKKFKEIIIFGIFGDRIDHLFANILLLSNLQTKKLPIKIKIIEGDKEIFIFDKKIIINGLIGDEVSIIPLNKLIGVTTNGLEYRLNNEELNFGSTRGISNVLNKKSVTITAKDGIALVIHSYLRKKNLRNNK